MKKFEIKLPEDVAKFFFWLVFDRHINIHPDDTVSQYVELDTGKPTFTIEEALYYDNVREKCFEVCEKFDVDIYDICMRVFNLFYFCDKNDTMEKFSKPE